MKIANIRVEHLREDLDPAFNAAWNLTPRTSFEADAADDVVVETDEGITGFGGSDPMAGFEDLELMRFWRRFRDVS